MANSQALVLDAAEDILSFGLELMESPGSVRWLVVSKATKRTRPSCMGRKTFSAATLEPVVSRIYSRCGFRKINGADKI
jgi:hypothetical protein